MKPCRINGKIFEWILISRRSCFRAGVRYYVRGKSLGALRRRLSAVFLKSTCSAHVHTIVLFALSPRGALHKQFKLILLCPILSTGASSSDVSCLAVCPAWACSSGVTCTNLLTSWFQTNVTSVTVCAERRTVMEGALCDAVWQHHHAALHRSRRC